MMEKTMKRQILSFNEWTVSGTIFRLKEFEGEFSKEFAASCSIEGVAKREGFFSTSVLHLPFLMQPSVYSRAKAKGIAKGKRGTFSGHLESWGDGKKKVMFVADDVIEIY